MYSTAVEIHNNYKKEIKNKNLQHLNKKVTSDFGLLLAMENLRGKKKIAGLFQLFKFSIMGQNPKYLIIGIKVFFNVKTDLTSSR